MATAIGDLIVRLQANSAPFEKNIRRASGVATRFAGLIRGVGATVSTVFGPIMAAASAGGVAMFTRRAMSAIDATAKLSDRIGVSTEGLMALRHAAEITGAGTARLDAGLETMSKRLGELSIRGTGLAKDAMALLGLKVEDLVKLKPDQAFVKIAEALEDVENVNKRAAIAAGLFSKRNMALLNTLELGGEGLQRMREEAESLGITFDREAARGVEQANDAITRLKRAAGGLWQQLAIQLAPIVEKVATRMVEWAKRVKAELVPAIYRLVVVVKDIAGRTASWLPLLLRMAKVYIALRIGIIGAAVALRLYALWQRRAVMWDIMAKAVRTAPNWIAVGAAIAAATASIVALDKAMGTIPDWFDESSKAAKDFKRSLDELDARGPPGMADAEGWMQMQPGGGPGAGGAGAGGLGRLPPYMERGSQEAWRRIQGATRGDHGADPMRELAKTSKESEKHLRSIDRKTEPSEVVGIEE